MSAFDPASARRMAAAIAAGCGVAPPACPCCARPLGLRPDLCPECDRLHGGPECPGCGWRSGLKAPKPPWRYRWFCEYCRREVPAPELPAAQLEEMGRRVLGKILEGRSG